MLKQMFMAGSLLMAVVFTGCAELREAKDPIDSDPAVATRFDGRWKVERQMFREGKPSSKQTGTAIGEMIGKHARLHSSDLKFELLFGIRQDGEYVLVNADSSRDRLLVGKDTDEEEEDGDAVEKNDDLNFEFGEELLGEISFRGNDMIEVNYFREHDNRERAVEKLLLTRAE